MKKIGLILFVLLILVFSCKSNRQVIEKNVVEKEVNYIPYYLKVYEADSLYITNNYQKSYKILDSLFKIYKPIDVRNINEVLTFYKLKIILRKRIKKQEISKLISEYGYSEEIFLNDSLFKIYNIQSDKYLLKIYPSMRKKYNNMIDLSLRNQIKEMKINDQFYRKKNYKDNLESQTKIDLKNQSRIIEIFNDFGFPNEKLIGNFTIDKINADISVILLHTKDSIRKAYFMPKILEYIKKGEASPELYANLHDQLLLYNGDSQYYGSYENEIKISIKEVNNRRKKIGLPNYGYLKWRLSKLFQNQ